MKQKLPILFSILFLLGLKGFSENLKDLTIWSTPVALELVPVALVNLYPTDLNVSNNKESNFLAFDAYYSPECPTEGTACNDNNPNTTNDVIAADCVCRGIAVTPATSCTDAQLTYELNGGPRRPGVPALTVAEGDDIALFSNLENYTITGPNGLVAGNVINDISSANDGVYTVNGTYRTATPAAAPMVHFFSSQETAINPASNAIDGNINTIWHTRFSGANVPITGHEIQLDMGENSVLSGFTYLPRQTGTNGRVLTYNIFVSNSTTDWGTAVVSNGSFVYDGNAANQNRLRTVAFPAKSGRYLRFEVLTSVGNFASAAEINGKRVTATANSAEPINPASNALDNNISTFWHSRYSSPAQTGPHNIDLDLGMDSNVSALTYLPRQDGNINGRILNYAIYVSNSSSVWPTAPVTTGTLEYSSSNPLRLRTINFTETRGRYVRLVATSAQTDITGGDFASAAEIRVIRSTVNMPCSKTITLNVDPIIVYTYNGTWSPEDPRNIVTANDTVKIASGNFAVSSNLTHYNLTVQAGASLTVDAGVTLTTNTLTLESESNMYSSLIRNGSIIADEINYKRHTNIRGTALGGGNDLISAPLAGQEFGAFAAANTTNLSASGTKRALAIYNTAAGEFQNYDITTNASTVLASGVAFRAATDDGSKLIFTGTVPNADVDVALSGAAAGGAWNLIGNPYPSYMDVSEFFSEDYDNSAQFNPSYVAIYGYTGDKNNWKIYNNLSGAGFLLAPGQGFFVKAKTTGGSIKFTPAMRRVGNTDDFILGRPQNVNKVLSKLKLSDATNDAVTSVYFVDGSTKGLDPGYDAAAYAATKVDFGIYTNLLEDNNGLDIAIQALPYNDFNGVVVPLGIKAKAGTELSISIDELSTLPSNINVYLEDTKNNTLTLLNDGDYTFKLTADVNGSDRFNVHYSAKTLSVADMDSNDNLRIYTTASPKTLYIKGQLTRATTANLYDIQGRLVLSKVLNSNSAENKIDISTISTGVYVVKVNDDNQVKTQKVIIK